MFEKTLMAGWGDMDFNSHMKNTARLDGKLAARVTSAGGWLDLSARRLAPAPEALLAVLNTLPGTADFQVLPTSLR